MADVRREVRPGKEAGSASMKGQVEMSLKVRSSSEREGGKIGVGELGEAMAAILFCLRTRRRR